MEGEDSVPDGQSFFLSSCDRIIAFHRKDDNVWGSRKNTYVQWKDANNEV